MAKEFSESNIENKLEISLSGRKQLSIVEGVLL